MAGRIEVAVAEGVAVVTIAHEAKLNTLNPALMREFAAVMAGLSADDALRGVVLTGAGPKAFVGGADIAVMAGLADGAAEAAAWGLVERVVPAAGLDAAVAEWVACLLAAGAQALRRQKALLRQWETLPLAEAIAAGIPAFAASWDTPEPRQMLGAFAARRG